MRYYYSGSYHVDLFSFGALVSGSSYELFGLAGFRWLTELSSSAAFALAVFIGTTLAIIIVLADELMTLRRKSPEAIVSRIGSSLLVAGFMALVSPLMFAFLLPSAINSSGDSAYAFQFWGSVTTYGASLNYGPNVGWYLQILAFFLIVFSIVAIFLSRPSPTIPVDSQKATVSSIDTQPQTPIPEPDIGRPLITLCGNCRKEIPIDSRLCPYCGTEVKR